MVAEVLHQDSSLSPHQQVALKARERSAASAREAAYDAELIRRFNRGDEGAFVEIVERHREKMVAIALRFLRNHADAEEVAQDVFVRAHGALGRFRYEASLATWLHRIALNQARSRYQYFRRHSTFSLDQCFGESRWTFAEVIPHDAATPSAAVLEEEFSERILEGMQKLSASQRKILQLRGRSDESYADIGRILGIKAGTVKSRISRARENLRKIVIDAYPGLAADPEPLAWSAMRSPAEVPRLLQPQG